MTYYKSSFDVNKAKEILKESSNYEEPIADENTILSIDSALKKELEKGNPSLSISIIVNVYEKSWEPIINYYESLGYKVHIDIPKAPLPITLTTITISV